MTRTVMLSKDPLEKASRAKISVPKLESLLNLQKYNIMYYILRREAKGNIELFQGFLMKFILRPMNCTFSIK